MTRHALLIATTQHSDALFSRSTAPEADVRSFAAALRSPDIGGFDSVVELVNRPSDVLREEIEGFFQKRTEDDLLVLYFSGHGVVNSRGQLHLVTASTKRDRLAATAIPADFVRDQMDECGSRQQVLILDCSYGGASDGAQGGVGASVGIEAAFEGNGLGRIVMTATDTIQFAFEAGDPIMDPSSAFTHFLVEGLEGGAADLDGDGRTTVNDLCDYACQQLIKAGSKLAPRKWSYWQRGEMILATKPRQATRPDLLSPSNVKAPGADVDPGSVSSRSAESGDASGEKPVQVAQAVSSTAPIQPVPTEGTNTSAPHRPGVPRSYASLRPKSSRPSSPEPGPAQVAASAVPVPPPDLASAAAGPAGSPSPREVATPDASLGSSPDRPGSAETGAAQIVASAIPTPPLELFAAQPSSLPPVEVPRSSVEGAAVASKPRSRRPPRLLFAGGAGFLVAALAIFLVTRKGALEIEVRPTGNWSLGEIAVMVDGEKKCTHSPCRVEKLAAGAHQVAVTAAGYRRQALPVGVSRGAVNPVPITLELDGPTGVAVAELGPDVQLFVDGKSRGYVPQEISPLAPGEHEIRIEGGERYQTFTTRVTVEAGKMVSMAPKLKVKKGRVTIQPGMDADEAKIELLCGDQRRPAPKQAFDVAPEQSCRVVATKDGFEPFDQAIQFQDGEAERLIKVDLVASAEPRPASAGSPQASQGASAEGRTPRLPERHMPERGQKP